MSDWLWPNVKPTESHSSMWTFRNRSLTHIDIKLRRSLCIAVWPCSATSYPIVKILVKEATIFYPASSAVCEGCDSKNVHDLNWRFSPRISGLEIHIVVVIYEHIWLPAASLGLSASIGCTGSFVLVDLSAHLGAGLINKDDYNSSQVINEFLSSHLTWRSTSVQIGLIFIVTPF